MSFKNECIFLRRNQIKDVWNNMSWVNNSEEFKNAHWESYSFNFHQVGVK